MAVLALPLWIFGVRTLDRLGKGLRTAARDALLAGQATPQTSARVFGFHRGMDTLGAVIGPLLALLFLHYFPGQYRSLFVWAIIPGAFSVAFIFLLREKRQPSSTLRRGHFFSFFRYWSIAAPAYKKLVAGLLMFTLFNSSDVFLLLKAREATGSDTATILVYAGYNLLYALLSYPLGMLADRVGLKPVFIAGILTFALVYAIFSLSQTAIWIGIAFGLYALYAAATEGIAKAWITQVAGKQNLGTALGFYTSGQSVCSLLASSLTGLVWTLWGSTTAFLLSAAAAVGTAIWLAAATSRR